MLPTFFGAKEIQQCIRVLGLYSSACDRESDGGGSVGDGENE